MRQHKESYPARSAPSPASCRAFITPFLFLFLLFFFPAMWDALVAPLSVPSPVRRFLNRPAYTVPRSIPEKSPPFFLVLLLAVPIIPTKKSPETSKVFKFEIYLHNQLSRVFCLTPTTTYFFFLYSRIYHWSVAVNLHYKIVFFTNGRIVLLNGRFAWLKRASTNLLYCCLCHTMFTMVLYLQWFCGVSNEHK